MGNPKGLVENPACAGQQLIPDPPQSNYGKRYRWIWDQLQATSDKPENTA